MPPGSTRPWQERGDELVAVFREGASRWWFYIAVNVLLIPMGLYALAVGPPRYERWLAVVAVLFGVVNIVGVIWWIDRRIAKRSEHRSA